jgi:ABC-2 type transport system permease protein
MLARQEFNSAFSKRSIQVVIAILLVLLVYGSITGYTQFRQQTKSKIYYQELVRKHWEEMPDKHPHRMAHYGYIAFRTIDPLSIFDKGLENYTGNAIFLEAHKQNTINFSEASLSTGLLRFGEISQAMVLQLLVPLLLFFIGFGIISTDRENGTLKILLGQGASWRELLIGKCFGLWMIGSTILVAGFLLLIITSIAIPELTMQADWWMRVTALFVCYAIYFWIICSITVWISAISQSSRVSLVSLIGIWLLMGTLVPRAMQSGGAWLFPAPSKISFDAAVEKELIKKGDSHDPNDPYYKALKDSVLRAHNVQSIEELPFNYSGFQMKEGERISAELYNQQMADLLGIYNKQNSTSRFSSLINPFMAIRFGSMALAGTDFASYARFQSQAEQYRYNLAQQMNDWQIRFISNRKPGTGEKGPSISRDFWKEFPEFSYSTTSWKQAMLAESGSISFLIFWFLLSAWVLFFRSQKLNAL